MGRDVRAPFSEASLPSQGRWYHYLWTRNRPSRSVSWHDDVVFRPTSFFFTGESLPQFAHGACQLKANASRAPTQLPASVWLCLVRRGDGRSAQRAAPPSLPPNEAQAHSPVASNYHAVLRADLGDSTMDATMVPYLHSASCQGLAPEEDAYIGLV